MERALYRRARRRRCADAARRASSGLDTDRATVGRTRRQTRPRVTDQAKGGQVLITDQVRKGVGDVDGVTFTPLPSPDLKGVDEHVAIYIAERI